MLILDDAIQTTERDEYTYHEMLAHLPLVTHPAPQRVLIIGGGDGGPLEEPPNLPLQHVTLVEIDRNVVAVCRRFRPGFAAEAFHYPRPHLWMEDGTASVRASPERFD